jgi:hypothetical protein
MIPQFAIEDEDEEFESSGNASLEIPNWPVDITPSLVPLAGYEIEEAVALPEVTRKIMEKDSDPQRELKHSSSWSIIPGATEKNRSQIQLNSLDGTKHISPPQVKRSSGAVVDKPSPTSSVFNDKLITSRPKLTTGPLSANLDDMTAMKATTDWFAEDDLFRAQSDSGDEDIEIAFQSQLLQTRPTTTVATTPPPLPLPLLPIVERSLVEEEAEEGGEGRDIEDIDFEEDGAYVINMSLPGDYTASSVSRSGDNFRTPRRGDSLRSIKSQSEELEWGN